MTDTTPNLPEPVRFAGAAPDMTLAQAPTSALVFALGYAAARPVSVNTFGPFCAMVEELGRRPSQVAADGWLGSSGLGEWNAATELGRLLATLPEAMARQITLLYQAQRGQRWAATGHRGGPPPR